MNRNLLGIKILKRRMQYMKCKIRKQLLQTIGQNTGLEIIIKSVMALLDFQLYYNYFTTLDKYNSIAK